VVPGEAVTLYERSTWGELADALELYARLIPLLDLLGRAEKVQAIKLASSLAGHGHDHVRLPRLPLEGARRAEASKALRLALAVAQLDDGPSEPRSPALCH
jgi:1-pyrroline-4-hydroxy-2-carboxylate deaminase